MSTVNKLKVRLVATGLALATSLTGAFNLHADEALLPVNSKPAVTQKIANDNPALLQTLSRQLLDETRAVDAYYTADNPAFRKPGYVMNENPVIKKAIERVIGLLDSGADPNFTDPETGMSSFVWGIWMAYELDKPEIVAAFLKHGANPRQKIYGDVPIPSAEKNFMNILSPDQKKRAPGNLKKKAPVSIMDHAFRMVIESQDLFNKDHEGRGHVRTAADIVKMLVDAGGRLEDAAQTVSNFNLKSYVDLAQRPLILATLRNAGLISRAEFNEEFTINGELAEVARTTTDIDKAFLEKHGATLLDDIYSDALPGGSEPYKVQDGDTLEKLANRFRHAMEARNDDHAVKLIAENNNIDTTSDDALTKPLEAGTVLSLPIPVEHQVGHTIVSPYATIYGMALRLQEKMGVKTNREAVNLLASANSNLTKPSRLYMSSQDAFQGSPEDQIKKIDEDLKRMPPQAMGMRRQLEQQKKQITQRAQQIKKAETYLKEALKPGNTLSVPITLPMTGRKMIVQEAIQPGDTIRGIADILADGSIDTHSVDEPHKAGADADSAMKHVLEMNGLNLEALLSGEQTIELGQKLWVTYHNDNYKHMDALVPPETRDPNHKVSLIMIEPDGYHGKRTFGVAGSTGYGLNPDVDMSRFHLWEGELFSYPSPNISDALRIMMNLGDSALRDQVIFSFSMAVSAPGGKQGADKIRMSNPSDHISFERIREMMDEMEYNKPIIFGGAGNYRMQVPDGSGMPEGRYVQAYLAMHSPRAVNMGAADNTMPVSPKGATTITPYSSYAADICATVPHLFGASQNGTSFSTPEMGSITRQMLEWYGNKLDFEEIMAVGMMTGARDILDFDPVGGLTAGPRNAPRSVPAKFRTNGAGLPIHERCGSGNVDRETVKLWNEKLKTMVIFKDSLKNPGMFRSTNIDMGEPVEIRNGEGKNAVTEYIYHVKLPEDTTLGKLTFLLPQETGKHSEVFVKTPSGFEHHMPKSASDVVSTTAFNFEDMKKGDVIEIRTGEPLADTASVYVRGYDNGNSIQLMRAHLRTEGVLPAPLKTMEAGKITGDDTTHFKMPAKKKPAASRGNNPFMRLF